LSDTPSTLTSTSTLTLTLTSTSTSTSLIAILDIGKTNKKALVFNSDYEIIYESAIVLNETLDEDGDPCEDIQALSQWAINTIDSLLQDTRFDIRAINFSAYGASLVLLDPQGSPVAPLYNYLKPLDQELMAEFFSQYGGETQVAIQTASPVMGNLNSGLQLYRVKKVKPLIFKNLGFVLHLPQYLSYLFTHQPCTDLTSLGCHTLMWDFELHKYATWVEKENLEKILALIYASDQVFPIELNKRPIQSGLGLHDSSAALIPYLAGFPEPFLLLSTGTWCIALNPFNDQPLTPSELSQDCLCYLSFQGKPVKASRLFSGYEHEEQVLRIAGAFKVPSKFYLNYEENPEDEIISPMPKIPSFINSSGLRQSGFVHRDLSAFDTAESAYRCLIHDLVGIQVDALNLVLKNTGVRQIFVDGGFSKNRLFMKALAQALPEFQVYGATVAQASALGAALVIHQHWNEKQMPDCLVKLIHYREGGAAWLE